MRVTDKIVVMDNGSTRPSVVETAEGVSLPVAFRRTVAPKRDVGG